LTIIFSSFGYHPIFFERQMLVQILYDNLKDKSKILTGKAVAHLESNENVVQATTSDGDRYIGNILIGADGIHSSVRREMWRIGDEEQPHWFNQKERERG
jgi:2-polyprenyl-6-methoxyphenol hydroxylase-like FAD-dependent oxidoreductase